MPQFRTDFCRAEQHGGVAVVTAGVHGAGLGRFIGQIARFGNRQGVHIGPQGDGFAWTRAGENSDHAAWRKPRYRQAHALQLGGYLVAGFRFCPGHFGAGMDVPAPGNDLILVLFGEVSYFHSSIAALHFFMEVYPYHNCWSVIMKGANPQRCLLRRGRRPDEQGKIAGRRSEVFGALS